jgi:hypothetical protein
MEKDHSSLNHQKRSLFGSGNNSSSSNNSTKSYSSVIESVRFYENAIQQLQTQIDEAKIMVSQSYSHC